MKQSGGASAATMLALHGMRVEVLAQGGYSAPDDFSTSGFCGVSGLTQGSGTVADPYEVSDGTTVDFTFEAECTHTTGTEKQVQYDAKFSPSGGMTQSLTGPQKGSKSTPQPVELAPESPVSVGISIDFGSEDTMSVSMSLYKTIDGVRTLVETKTKHFKKVAP